MARTHSPARILAIMGWLLLSGCAQRVVRDDSQWAATEPAEAQHEPVANGSIYHDSQNMELFADSRAHRVGDILTVVLEENTQASKKASTSTDKTDKTSIGVPTILGHSLSIGGQPASTTATAARSFAGDGSSSQSNQLTGQITVTVAKRLSNGNLFVRGEKWLTINQGQELVRISGIVRPQDIGQDNSVVSTRVADAHIEYTGRGSLANANTQGWLSRFFNSKWMPF